MADDIKSSLPELKLLSSAELRDTSVLESNDLVGALRENDA